MHDSVRFKLHFGPYSTPRFRYGQKVLCEVRGEVTICGTTAAPIAWPIGRIGPLKSLVVYRGLASAIRQESVQAVAHHWGITAQTVTKWRRRLGIKGEPLGTSHTANATLRRAMGRPSPQEGLGQGARSGSPREDRRSEAREATA